MDRKNTINKRVKWIITIVLLIALVFALIPEARYYDDGGTVEYKALLYSVTNYHNFVGDKPDFMVGIKVDILGITIYEKFEIVPEKIDLSDNK